ncbi:AI-2E family transporter [Bacillus coahuilensis]
MEASIKKWLYRCLLLLFSVTSCYIIYLLAPVWQPFLRILLLAATPFIIGAFVTYLLHPVVEKLHEAGLHRVVALLIIYLLFFGGVGFGIYKGFPAILDQLRELSANVPLYIREYRGWLSFIHDQTSMWPEALQVQLEERIVSIEKWGGGLVERTLGVLLSFMNHFFLILLIPFISFYLLKDFERVKEFIWKLVPPSKRERGREFARALDESLGGYIRGQLLVCLILGGCAFVAFWLIGLKYPLLLGAVVAVTNIIPYFGPLVGAVPAVIIASTISVNMILFVGGIILLLQFLEGNILSPLIVGRSLHLHPLFIMGALVIGGELGGVIGLIFAVPVLAIVKTAILQGRHHFKQKSEEYN